MRSGIGRFPIEVSLLKSVTLSFLVISQLVLGESILRDSFCLRSFSESTSRSNSIRLVSTVEGRSRELPRSCQDQVRETTFRRVESQLSCSRRFADRLRLTNY